MQSDSYLAGIAIALIFGITGWVLASWRSRKTVEALVTAATSQAGVELATLRERLRSTEEQAALDAERARVSESERGRALTLRYSGPATSRAEDGVSYYIIMGVESMTTNQAEGFHI